MDIPMTFDRGERVPRHPDWKWEYFDGAAQLSYRPKPLHARRSTAAAVPADDRHQVRLLTGPGDDVRTFLAGTWRAEDPYRTIEEPDGWLADGLDRSCERLAGPHGAVVEERGEIVGAVLLERPYRDGTAPFLSWLSVRAGYRCDGVGTAMLGAIIGALDAAGVPHLDSDVSVGNRASVAWHWRNGFVALHDELAGFGWDARRR